MQPRLAGGLTMRRGGSRGGAGRAFQEDSTMTRRRSGCDEGSLFAFSISRMPPLPGNGGRRVSKRRSGGTTRPRSWSDCQKRKTGLRLLGGAGHQEERRVIHRLR